MVRVGRSNLIAFLIALTIVPMAAHAAEPFYPGMGKHHRAVTTNSKLAQRYFDQGLVFMSSFNHGEAIRSFEAATELDSTCAMAWWGIALANGPHINNPAMSPEESQAAWAALERARALLDHASPVERALVEALGKRYAQSPPEDRRPLEEAYAAAMREVWKQFPQDADVGALCAEALMDVHPWDLWTQDGAARPWTPEILATIDAVLAIAPRHPAANHLNVHAREASPHPEEALPSADRLKSLVPGAGHMVHMPAHIYCRVGRWADASAANVRAIEADRAYRARSPRQGFYNVYMAHNRHFLSWSSQMEGRETASLEAARGMLANMPEEFVREAAFFADGFMNILMEAQMRFGRWDEILATPEPPDYLPITRTYRHYARATAHAAMGDMAEAKAEQAAFREALGKVGEDRIVGNNPARLVLSIAEHQLEGEIRNRQGDVDGAVTELTEAVRIEDSLVYDEAPDWLLPIRHALGAVLVRAKRWPEAEAVYRADLARYTENGWSLWGLERALREQARIAEADAVHARFRKAWKRADVSLSSTCYCQVWN